MTLIDNFTEEEIIDGFVQRILDEDPDFSFMSEDEQKKIFGIYTLLITAVHRALQYDNVYPVVYANDDASKKVVEKAIANVAPILPDISRITVALVH
tara:strand:- start:799 stop:1089 length:291 start_codon:yes stop_codon:yes gene_type:complete